MQELLLATIVAITGSTISHYAIWYRIGKMETKIKELSK